VTSCLPCPSGTFSNSAGASYCLSCPMHFYSDANETWGPTSCFECPRGSGTLTNGSAGIGSCKVQDCSSFSNSFIDSGGSRHFFEVSSKSPERFFKANYLCSNLLHGAHLFQVDTNSSLNQVLNLTLGPSTQVHFGAYNLGLRNFNWIDQSLPVDYNAFFPSTSFSGVNGKSNCTYFDTSQNKLKVGPFCKITRNYWCQISEVFCSLNSSCPNGQFLNTSGYRPVCDVCSPGSVGMNGISCSICDKGYYQDKANASACIGCPSGKVSNASAVGCQPCPSGFSTSSDQSRCIPCDQGKYQPFNTSAYCLSCLKGFFANATASTACIECQDGTTETIGAVKGSDCACKEGYYGNLPLISCRRCQDAAGIRCPFNSSIPSIEPGYYRSGTTGDDVNVALTCQPSEACESTETNSTTKCNVAYNGYLCGQCSSGYYRSGSACKKCPGDAIKWLTLAALVIAIVFVLGRVTSKRVELPVDFRISLQAVQMIALFPNITTNWPEYVRVILQIYTVTVSSPSLLFQLV
jgi:hypothetical protein